MGTEQILKLAVLALKIAGVFVAVKYGISEYNHSVRWSEQGPIVWVLLYLPIFMGYESILKLLLETILNKMNKQTKP